MGRDPQKRDEDDPEHRSRLFAQNIKRDQHKDLFAATLPFQAKKFVRSLAVMEGIGY